MGRRVTPTDSTVGFVLVLPLLHQEVMVFYASTFALSADEYTSALMFTQEAIDLTAGGNGGLRARLGYRKSSGGISKFDGLGQGTSLG